GSGCGIAHKDIYRRWRERSFEEWSTTPRRYARAVTKTRSLEERGILRRQQRYAELRDAVAKGCARGAVAERQGAARAGDRLVTAAKRGAHSRSAASRRIDGGRRRRRHVALGAQ